EGRYFALFFYLSGQAADYILRGVSVGFPKNSRQASRKAPRPATAATAEHAILLIGSCSRLIKHAATPNGAPRLRITANRRCDEKVLARSRASREKTSLIFEWVLPLRLSETTYSSRCMGLDFLTGN